MNKKILRFASTVIVFLLLLPLFTFNSSASSAYNSNVDLGTVSECKYNKTDYTIEVTGSIKHAVMVDNRESRVGLFSFLPWEDPELTLETKEPLALIDMTMRFEFIVPCNSTVDKLSLYGVAVIDSSGTPSLIDEPRFVDSRVATTANLGFKGISTSDSASAVSAGAKTAIVDVYLDKLDIGNKSGYIFSVDGTSFFFDRQYIDEIDRQVRSYYASGCDVIFRYRVSEGDRDLPFTTAFTKESSSATFSVKNEEALVSLYAYSYFLASRYNSYSNGWIKGIMLGTSVDFQLFGHDDHGSFAEDYARALSVVAISSIEATSDKSLAFIIPVSDLLSENKTAHCFPFLASVASYLEERTKITFSVMCESTHSPYKLSDVMLDSVIDPDDTMVDADYADTVTTEEITTEEVTTFVSDYITNSSETEPYSLLPTPDDTAAVQDDTTLQEEETQGLDESAAEDTSSSDISDLTGEGTEPQPPDEPTINTLDDGFFCSDSIEVFTRMVRSLSITYDSVNSGFGWSWTPTDETQGSALGVCNAYNYAKLAAVEADFYILNLMDDNLNVISKISHQFKFIDTSKNEEVTQYARDVFGINSWSQMIVGYSDKKIVVSEIRDTSLEADERSFLGSCDIWNYSTASGTKKWYQGFGCKSISYSSLKTDGSLKAEFSNVSTSAKYADIGIICDDPEPLLFGDALGFDLVCGESDGSLYEFSVLIYCEDFRVESSVVLEGGSRHELILDTSSFSNTAKVESLRLCVKRITGEGDFDMSLYRVTTHSNNYTSDALEKIIDEAREILRTDSDIKNDSIVAAIIVSVSLISVVGVILVTAAVRADRRYKKEDNK